ncbi:decaheme-associated outer membrane protein, MtrB/PioB family [Burkholderiaceae bacterium]|nr:decaheme-associated outer membrane protein, MtrB/PioB family [Burkholderiaceae bacterium]
MKTSTPLWLLGALGALSITTGTPVAAADPSQWTCETCPFEEPGVSGSVDVGVGVVTKESARFGDFTGLDRKGGHLIAGGEASYRGKAGGFGSFSATDLGLDSRTLAGELGREGRYSLRIGYAELPRHYTDSASTPFLGTGSTLLTLPAGFPADTTADMPLAGTLQPVDIGTKRSRLDVGASLIGSEQWSYRVNVRHDVRDGTQRGAGSFFSTASQLVLPVDQVTDRIEVSAAYTHRALQASLAYHGSTFRNSAESLTWPNPFTAGILGSGSGQLALAPDNEFHQVSGTLGYQISPKLRASAELAVGRMTQDSPYLAATLNPNLVVPALPAQSLRGRADTLDASVRLSAQASDRLRLSASLTRNERDNETPSNAYPSVSTDLFVGLAPSINLPYSFTRDRLKFGGDFRGPGSLKLAAGVEYDTHKRTLQETSRTREASVWGRASVQARENLSLSLKLAHAERDNTGYDAVASLQPQNPLMRKYNQADRRRDTASLRADLAVSEKVSAGLGVDLANDDYRHSDIGLTRARSAGISGDISAALSDTTQLRLFAQGERIRSDQAGSQLFALPDWTGRSDDEVEMLGVGLTHNALKGKLELAADLAVTRARSDTDVDTGSAAAPFPKAKTTRDTLKLTAQYRMSEKLSLLGSFWYERYASKDWHLDGVLPATVPNLLAFGEQAPRYSVNVLRVALRYRF